MDLIRDILDKQLVDREETKMGRVDGIVLAPLDNRALVRPVEEAKRAGVPTVIIDSALESDNIVSFVATDNRKGGMLGADRLGELLGGKGKVILLRYAEGSASTEEREAGFLQEMKQKFPNVEIISTSRTFYKMQQPE